MKLLSLSSTRRKNAFWQLKSPSPCISHPLVQHWILAKLSLQEYTSPTCPNLPRSNTHGSTVAWGTTEETLAPGSLLFPAAGIYSFPSLHIPALLGRLIIWVLLISSSGSLCTGVPLGTLRALPWDGHLHHCIHSGYPVLMTSGFVPTNITRGHKP